MSSRKAEKLIHKIFLIGILLKAFDGFLELCAGIAVLLTGKLALLTSLLIKRELVEDPSDFLATHLVHILPTILTHTGWFVAFYLLSHGVIKILLAIGLMLNKLWVYPTAIAIFILFIVYQVYAYIFSPSILLVVLTVLDAIIIWLTWHEYNYTRKHKTFPR